MIPSRNEAKPVILGFLADGQRRFSEEVQELIATHFALTPEERVRKRGKGPHPEYVNETAWALVDLQKDGLIHKADPEAFVYRITDSGVHAARTHSPWHAHSSPAPMTLQRRRLASPDPGGDRGVEEEARQALWAGVVRRVASSTWKR